MKAGWVFAMSAWTLAVLLTACGDGKGRLEGTWVLDVDGTIAWMKEKGIPAEIRDIMGEQLQSPEFQTGYMRFEGERLTVHVPGRPVATGTWKLLEQRGEAVWILENVVEGKEEPERTLITWLDDDRIAVGDPRGDPREATVLQRQARGK